MFSFKQIPFNLTFLKFPKSTNFGEKLVFDSYGFIIFSSDNPVDLHEQIFSVFLINRKLQFF